MSTYSDDEFLKRLYANITDYLGGASDFSTEREAAYDWVNDQLRGVLSVPISNPSETVKMAEANYAIYLILRANSVGEAFDFLTQAESLISVLKTEQLSQAQKGGPTSNTLMVRPTFTMGRFDEQGFRIGPKGSLDDF